ncbi:MAG: MBL fold metallo-hydrolase [Phycisphaera sp.]|nr:MBL fold metallo-hydrolase [Phycisphaera sp.]
MISAMSDSLEIHTFPLGDWQTNCYVVHPAGSTDCWIVDAGYEPEVMIDAIQRAGLNPVKLMLTHAHLDHIGGIPQVKAAWPDLPIVIHEAEREFLNDPMLNLSIALGIELRVGEADELLKGGETVELAGVPFEVRHTPGHSPGGLTFYQPDAGVALVGDTLFNGSIGRYDFPTSHGPTLFASIREQLFTLPDDTRVFPGHGPDTTIGHERRTNPFF